MRSAHRTILVAILVAPLAIAVSGQQPSSKQPPAGQDMQNMQGMQGDQKQGQMGGMMQDCQKNMRSMRQQHEKLKLESNPPNGRTIRRKCVLHWISQNRR